MLLGLNLSELAEPLRYDFMRRALLMGALIGSFGPVLGSYLIVLRMALLGDVIAHGVLPGLAIAHFFGWPVQVGAFGSGMLSTVLIAWIKARSRLKADAVMAMTFASFFALGVCLISVLKRQVDLDSLLFGDILSVQGADLVWTGGVGVLVVGAIALFYRPLLMFTFDPAGAEAMGLPMGWLHYGLMALVTLTILAGMQAVGVVLVIALMVGPAMTAFLLVRELHWMMILGGFLGTLASTIGIWVSYFWDLPSGPAIALVVFGLFALTLGLSPSQGMVWQQGRKSRQS